MKKQPTPKAPRKAQPPRNLTPAERHQVAGGPEFDNEDGPDPY